MLAVVTLGEKPNMNPLLLVMFCGSNHLIRRGLVGVILEITLVHILKIPSD